MIDLLALADRLEKYYPPLEGAKGVVHTTDLDEAIAVLRRVQTVLQRCDYFDGLPLVNEPEVTGARRAYVHVRSLLQPPSGVD